MTLFNFIRALFTYSEGDGDDTDDRLEEGDFFDELEDEESEGDDEGKGDETDDDDTDDDDADDADDDDDDDDDDDEDGESDDDDSDESGEGAEEEEEPQADSAALALRAAIKTRLDAAKAAKGDGAPSIDMPTVKAIKEAFPNVNEDDVEQISKIAAMVVQQTLSSYDSKIVRPVVEANEAIARANRLERGVREFNTEYPGALKNPKVSEAMSSIYDEMAKEYGVEGADSVSVEEYFLMTGAKGKKVAKKAAKGAVQKAADDQKKKAVKATTKPGHVAKMKAGKGRRKKGDPDSEAVKETMTYIRKRHIDPFTIR